MNHFKAFLFALFLDGLAGDPPNRFHPVAWMGRLIALIERLAPDNHRARLVIGVQAALGGSLALAGLGTGISRWCERLPEPFGWLVEGLLLMSTFSIRSLLKASGEVREALLRGDLAKARRGLAWHLVSRDTSGLNQSQVAAATIESIAENTSDGVLAPWLYYFLGGLPLALAYRWVNTLDSMWGYHGPIYEWLGKVPARLDDLVNWVPARLTAGFMILAGWFNGRNARQTWHIVRRDARRTASPNAGYPMSAMAGTLGVELEKVDNYKLGAGLHQPNPTDISRAQSVFLTTLALAGIGMSLFWLAGRRRLDG